MKRFIVTDEQAEQLQDAGVVTSSNYPNAGELIWWLEKHGQVLWVEYLYNINYHYEDNELIDELVHLCLEWVKE